MEDGSSPYPVGPSLTHVTVNMAVALTSPRAGRIGSIDQVDLTSSQVVEAPVAHAPEWAENALNGIGGMREARHGKLQERWEGNESVQTWDGNDEAMLGGSIKTVETPLRGNPDNSTWTVDTAAFNRAVEEAEQRANNETIDSNGLPRLGSNDERRPPQGGMSPLEHVDLTDLRCGCPIPAAKEKSDSCETDIADEAFGDGGSQCPLGACGAVHSDGVREGDVATGPTLRSINDATLTPLLTGKKHIQTPMDRCVMIARASISCAVIAVAIVALFLSSGSEQLASHVNSNNTQVPLEPSKGPLSITTTALPANEQRPEALEYLALSLEVKKVNAQRLILDADQSSAFESTVKAVIAAVGGHGIRSEDVLLDLSAAGSGDIIADSTVRIPSSISKHALAKRLGRQQLFNVALESKLADMAGFHKVTAGDISVKVATGDATLDAAAAKPPSYSSVTTKASVQSTTANGPHTTALRQPLATQAAVASSGTTLLAETTQTSRPAHASVNEGLSTASPSQAKKSGELATHATKAPTITTLPAASSGSSHMAAPNRRPAMKLPKALAGVLAVTASKTATVTALPTPSLRPVLPVHPAATATTPAAVQVAPVSPSVQPTSKAPSWLGEYRKRLTGQGQTLAVQIKLTGGMDTSTLTEKQLHDFSSAMTTELSKIIGIHVSAIENLEGVHGQLSVSTSRWGVTLTASGRVCLPLNIGIQDAVPLITSQHARNRLAVAMSEMPILQGPIHRAGSIGSFTVSAGQSSEDLFSKLDRNLNKLLDLQEFSTAARNLLRPPLKNNEIAEVYHQLDADHDGQLDADEFFGRFSRS
eukprot:CAMPEP_0172669078 /NCGR_PEP_ID=MMETSP1074-20121228/9457_1 /TAXON_ID=2916 /ORGANISM="Ceratium fusus, Strain PA161109" /LENGTH=820 /DNA_ID=CAMNT_0013485809 /DNA_START=26 /DNA_END=2488 /DNA_ORIENTATION=+